jgi:hypothetical protein
LREARGNDGRKLVEFYMRRAITIFLILNLLVLSGCHTLRRKFIRQKEHKKDHIVYVDFKEYPDAPSQESYRLYYIFADGWLDELIKSLNYTGNRKKQKHAISEVITNVEQMLSFFNEEGKKETMYLYRELLEVKDQIFSPQLDEIKKNKLAREVERLKREFRRKFSWRNVSLWVN